MKYTSEYGTATLTPIGPELHVSRVDGTSIIDEGFGFDIDTAAKLVLITGNQHLQPAYNMSRRMCYVVYHHSPNMVQVCRLDKLNYIGEDPHS